MILFSPLKIIQRQERYAVMKILSQDEEKLESINSKLDKGRQPQTTRLYVHATIHASIYRYFSTLGLCRYT